MQNHKTQQFAKFFLKDINSKNTKDSNEKSDTYSLRFSKSS